MGAVLILGGVVILLALAVSSKPASASKAVSPLPTPVPVHPDSKSVDVEAMAERVKDPVLKDKLQTTADILKEAERREVRLPGKMDPPAVLLNAGVSAGKWQDYVRKSIRGTIGNTSQAGALGLYQMGAKALHSIGWVELDANGRIVKWRHPSSAMTTKKFLTDPDAQYQAFSDYTYVDMVKLVESKVKPLDYVKNHVVLEGQHATLSGLLGLVYYAGIANAERWLTDPAWRDKAPKLTAQYKRFNGIF